ncbi:MAG: hypothetical protein ACP5N2_02665 [Candidatus Nanoarchaeia archaeon]
MTENYNALTQMLKQDPQLSLRIVHHAISSGLENARYSSIFEPNPHEGKVANPESGLDQQVLHGERWTKRGYKFAARDTIESLALLERACSGDKSVRNTVKESTRFNLNDGISGYSDDTGGIDTWIFNGFYFTITNEPSGLNAKMISYSFETDDTIIHSQKVENVDQGVDFYNNNPVSNDTIRDLKNGLLLENRIRKHSKLQNPEHTLFETTAKVFETTTAGVLNQRFQKYYDSLKELRPFDINNECKNAVFMSILLKALYPIQK